MNIIKNYDMPKDEILSSALIALGGMTPIQLANNGNGAWSVTGMGFVGGLLKPYTNREVWDMIDRAPTVLLKKRLGDDDAYLIKGVLPTITQEGTPS